MNSPRTSDRIQAVHSLLVQPGGPTTRFLQVAAYGIKWGDCGSRDPIEDCVGWEKSEVTGCDMMRLGESDIIGSRSASRNLRVWRESESI